MASTKMVPSCQPGSISRGEPASPSSLTCGCTLGAKKKLTISLNLSSKDCDVAAFLFLNHQQFIFKSLASSIINLRTPGYFIAYPPISHFQRTRRWKREKGHTVTSFSYLYTGDNYAISLSILTYVYLLGFLFSTCQVCTMLLAASRTLAC